MFGSLQATGSSFAGPFRLFAIMIATAGSIIAADNAHCGTPPAVDGTAPAQPAEPAPCHPDMRYVAPAEVAAGLPWRLVPCAREAGAVCTACATCSSDAWCAPVKTRGIGPRSPGGGPDD